jgi:hypothetical protein
MHNFVCKSLVQWNDFVWNFWFTTLVLTGTITLTSFFQPKNQCHLMYTCICLYVWCVQAFHTNTHTCAHRMLVCMPMYVLLQHKVAGRRTHTVRQCVDLDWFECRCLSGKGCRVHVTQRIMIFRASLVTKRHSFVTVNTPVYTYYVDDAAM